MSSTMPAASDPENTPIGLIGVGTMGRFILQRLLEAGYPVVAYDVSAEAIDLAKSWGSEVVSSPAEVSNACKSVLLCLPGPFETEQIVFGEDELLNRTNVGHSIIDLSTSDLETTAPLAGKISKKQATLLDAPILGHPSSIGNWVLPVVGEAQVLEKSSRVLTAYQEIVREQELDALAALLGIRLIQRRSYRAYLQ